MGRQESAASSPRGNRVLVSGRDVPYYKFDSASVTALGGPRAVDCCLTAPSPFISRAVSTLSRGREDRPVIISLDIATTDFALHRGRLARRSPAVFFSRLIYKGHEKEREREKMGRAEERVILFFFFCHFQSFSGRSPSTSSRLR